MGCEPPGSDTTRCVTVRCTSRLNGSGSGVSSTSRRVPAVSPTAESRRPSTVGDSGIASSAIHRSNRRWRTWGSPAPSRRGLLGRGRPQRRHRAGIAGEGRATSVPARDVLREAGVPAGGQLADVRRRARRRAAPEQRPGPSMTTASRPSRRSPRTASTDVSRRPGRARGRRTPAPPARTAPRRRPAAACSPGPRSTHPGGPAAAAGRCSHRRARAARGPTRGSPRHRDGDAGRAAGRIDLGVDLDVIPVRLAEHGIVPQPGGGRADTATAPSATASRSR